MLTEQGYGIIPASQHTDGTWRFLVVKQADNEKWGFPKGHPEEGETAEETALRELREETGITDCTILACGPFSEHYIKPNKDGSYRNKTVTYFVGFTSNPATTLQQEEIADSAWLSASDALARLTYAESKEIFKTALTFCMDELLDEPLHEKTTRDGNPWDTKLL